MTRKNKTPNSSILASETWLFTTPSSSCFIHTYISTTFWSATSIFFAHWKLTWVVPLELKCIASKIHTKRYTHKEILISDPYVFFFLQQQPYRSDTHLFTIMSKCHERIPFIQGSQTSQKKENPHYLKTLERAKDQRDLSLSKPYSPPLLWQVSNRSHIVMPRSLQTLLPHWQGWFCLDVYWQLKWF